ncbi:hypothetical protein A2U01_0110108, partial [Trifolium medium]|nr:hypothetical protein [Trifolium medium]
GGDLFCDVVALWCFGSSSSFSQWVVFCFLVFGCGWFGSAALAVVVRV